MFTKDEQNEILSALKDRISKLQKPAGYVAENSSRRSEQLRVCESVIAKIEMLGVKGGQSVSEAKALAARANGKKGGRPRKVPKTDYGSHVSED